MSTSIVVPPPNFGPEPPGLLDAVRSRVFGQGGAPGLMPEDHYAPLMQREKAIQLLTDTRKMVEPGREQFEYAWWRNLLYFLGRQWVYWNPGTREFRDKRLAKWIPKPVTNYIRTTTLSIRATMSDIQLTAHARPNGQAPRNILAAQIADDIEPAIQHDHDIKSVFDIADFWTILLGNAFLHPHWDKDDPQHQISITPEMCLLCQFVSTPDQLAQTGGNCPNCGSPTLQPLPQQMMTIGKGKTIVASPLEVLLPLYATDFEQADRLIYLSWMPEHQIVDQFGQEMAKKVSSTSGPDVRSMQLFKALATTSDLVSSPSAWNTGTFTGYVNGATVQHLWIRPCKQYPEGVYLKFLGGTNAEPIYDEGRDRMDIPSKTKDGRPIWPWIHYQYEPIGGRLYSQGAVDSIIQKNDQLNQIDSLNQLTAQRMGNPIWLEPKGAEVERFTGEPGLVVKYMVVGASGAKPERIPGENVPQSFFALRQQYIGDIEELAGTYDVLKGSKPAGVEAFSALQLLVDRSQSRFKTAFKARGEAYRKWYGISLELERVHGPATRVHATLGPNRAWTFQAFERVQLDGDVTIVIEDGTNMPKTTLGRRAAIEHANQMGLINAADPEVQFSLLTELGIPTVIPSLDADVKECQREQQAFEDWAAAGFPGGPPANPLVRLPWHQDRVHLAENRKWMNSDTVRAILDRLEAEQPQILPLIIQALADHLNQHLQMAVQQAMADQAMSGQPAPPEGGTPGNDKGGRGAGRAAHDSNQQSGSTEGAAA